MARAILVPVDGSPKSVEGAEYALSTDDDASITVLHVLTPHDVDHVIMGSHGRDEESPLPLGSVAQTAMRRSPVLVSIVR